MPAASNKGVMVNSNRATVSQDMDKEDMPNRLLSTVVEDMVPPGGQPGGFSAHRPPPGPPPNADPQCAIPSSLLPLLFVDGDSQALAVVLICRR